MRSLIYGPNRLYITRHVHRHTGASTRDVPSMLEANSPQESTYSQRLVPPGTMHTVRETTRMWRGPGLKWRRPVMFSLGGTCKSPPRSDRSETYPFDVAMTRRTLKVAQTDTFAALLSGCKTTPADSVPPALFWLTKSNPAPSPLSHYSLTRLTSLISVSPSSSVNASVANS